MNKVKTIFSIKDLENLSGIKAHTIRIWEKRYNLLSPNRTDTNIRFYSSKSLQKLLNITLLYNNGVKISKISELSEEGIIQACQNIISEQSKKNVFINDLKLAMLNFDQSFFERSYQKLSGVIDFKEIYVNYFLPFLSELGLLWSTDSINPAHEHFISALIKQKILIHTEKLQGKTPTENGRRFVLYLPENEIHDIGLSYTNYEVLKRGYGSVYLGQSIPMNCLTTFSGFEDQIIFITYFTVEPASDKIPDYINAMHNEILSKGNCELWILGRKAADMDKDTLPKSIRVMSMPEMIEIMDSFKYDSVERL